MRASSNTIGAASPMLAAPGVAAITSDPPHIMVTDKVSAILRPTRSAYRPINHAPTGRARNPTANTAAVCRSCAVWSPLGKKTGAKYKAFAEYVYQSNHSTRLPAEPPSTALMRDAPGLLTVVCLPAFAWPLAGLYTTRAPGLCRMHLLP